MPIRPATPADLPALDALIHRAYRGDSARQGWTHEADLLDGQRTDPETLAAALATPTETILLADTAGHLQGCVQVSDKGNGLAYLGLLTVDPTHQAAGLGRTLIAAAEAHARGLGATAMEMTVIAQRSDLIAYYQRRGYALTGETRPFPHHDPRFGLPRTPDLAFVVLSRPLR
ncbi:GNAT family N-acetyltransferase [Sandaracinobacteroides saxicola]|uniref:GNAT family N-acetyltransferase n=1 Tax=Sandaracinobacteroides saxicola TaxID=2759707 RepID=A0A7G5IIZ8_9SPHN|nr:GNAT family N-acetyltransferase [Sandaracinobacteroides saxicola]QMW23340.1 GNAT family N-acetyltransferase [Sandaracinobacteroides saxicola]